MDQHGTHPTHTPDAAGIDYSRTAMPPLDTAIAALDDMRDELLAEADDLVRRAQALEVVIERALTVKAARIAAHEAAMS